MVRKRQEERHHRGGKQKMRKIGMKIAVDAEVFCMAMPFASFAGTWKSDANGMWYQFDDGSYPKGRWAWIDTDNDGMAVPELWLLPSPLLLQLYPPTLSIGNCSGPL